MKRMCKRMVLFALCALTALAPLALADETAIIDQYIEDREAAITPSPSSEATATPVPTAKPTATVKATAAATPKPAASATAKATVKPMPTAATPEPAASATATARATAEPAPTAAPSATAKASASPAPSASPEASATATASPAPVNPNEGKVRTLYKNRYGSDVEALQDALTELGFFTSRVDGQFGVRTERALKKYQKARGLEADGVLGAQTRRALAEDGYEIPAWYPDVYPDGFERTLKKGMKGMDVRAVQEKLIEKGYLTGRADHIYGNKTRNAVKKFQEDNNLRVTGICNPQTLFLLMD